MVLGDFNAHHPSWLSRTRDDKAAARWEALDGAVNSSQLVVANQDLLTQLPSQGQPSSPDVTLLSRHGPHSPHLGLTISLSSHALPRSFTNFRNTDWEGYTAELAKEEICRYPSTNLLFCRGKSLQADPRQCQKTPDPLWLCQGLQRPSPRSYATPHLGERSAPH